MNWPRTLEILAAVGVAIAYGLAVYFAILWACVPVWVRAILRQLEALNKSQSETNRLLADILNPGSHRHRDSEATRNPFQ